MPRSVVAIDSTVYFASVARLVEGDPRPRCGALTAQEIRSHHPAAEMEKHRELAEKVIGAVLGGGKPELVVLVSPVAGTQKADPSAVRRIGVHWELVRQLAAAHVPVAEIPLLTVERAVVGAARWGKAGVKPLEEWVSRHFPTAVRPTRKTDDGNQVPDARYRMTTVALAALGCVAAGVPIPRADPDTDLLPITEDLLRIVQRGGSFPPEFRITPENHPADLARRERAAAKKISDRRRLEVFIEKKKEQELEFIAAAPLVELEDLKPRNPEAVAALRRRRARAEDAALEERSLGSS